jgi:hypothetical protein
VDGVNSTTRAQQAARDAAELIMFASGAIDAGITPNLAYRARALAREALWLAETLANERRLRIAMQAQRDQARQLLLERLHGEQAAS